MNRARIWDYWASYYDRLWVQYVSVAPTRRALLAELAGLPPGRLLDAGCGTAQLLDALQAAAAPWDYTGFDASAAMLAQAARKHPAARLTHADIMTYDAPPAAFDVVVCAHVFPYVPDQPAALARLAGWVNPGGYLLLAQACTETIYDRLVLAVVKLTTSPARYRSVADVCALAAPLLGQPRRVVRLNRHPGVPSLRLLVWRKQEGSST